ncbi:hypothetical protein C8Q80DRAFT_1342658 [Daedaleopsis nitida]|nr:hypothetical protein C8Q80DRAFT_1342658 [Daedaleopsis nitida]
MPSPTKPGSPRSPLYPPVDSFLVNVHFLGNWKDSKAWLVYSHDWQHGRKIRPLSEICARVEHKSVLVQARAPEAETQGEISSFTGTVLEPEAVSEHWVVFRLEERLSQKVGKSWICVPRHSADPFSCTKIHAHVPNSRARDLEGWRAPEWPLPFPDIALTSIRDMIMRGGPHPIAGILHIRSPNPAWIYNQESQQACRSGRRPARKIHFALTEVKLESNSRSSREKTSQESEVSRRSSDSNSEDEGKERRKNTPSGISEGLRGGGSNTFLACFAHLFRI